MKILLTILGVEIRLKQEVSLEPHTPALADVVRALRELLGGDLERFVNADLAPVDYAIILVNGRNMLSLQGWATEIKDGDELTFMVPVAGG